MSTSQAPATGSSESDPSYIQQGIQYVQESVFGDSPSTSSATSTGTETEQSKSPSEAARNQAAGAKDGSVADYLREQHKSEPVKDHEVHEAGH